MKDMSHSLRGGRALVACMMMIVGMPALDIALVVLVLPVVSLNDSSAESSWILGSYLLAILATTALWGSLSDRYGRRPLLLVGTALFAAGALGSAFSADFATLVVTRAIQGVGAGSMQSLTQAVAAEHFSHYAARGKALAFLSASWGGAAVLAPIIVACLPSSQWKWVFLTTLPLAVVVLFLFPRVYKQPRRRAGGPLDLAGCLLLLLIPLCVAALAANPPWELAGTAATLLVTAVTGLVIVERRVRNPILPLALLRRSGILPALLASIVLGVMIITTSISAPMYGQLVLGADATTSGAVFAAVSVAWTVSALATAPLLHMLGLRATGMLGAGIVALGYGMFGVLVILETDIWAFVLVGFVIGMGLGPFANSVVIGTQENAGVDYLGTASSLSMVSRSVGQTLGPALFALCLSLTAIYGATEEALHAPDPGSIADGVLLVYLLAATVSSVAVLLIWRMASQHDAALIKET